MLVTETTREVMAHRKRVRELLAAGYEEVGEGGGKLWELARGGRYDHVITDVVIGPSRQSVFVKIERR